MSLFAQMAEDVVSGIDGALIAKDKRVLAVEGALRTAFEMGQASVLAEVRRRIEANESRIVKP